MAELSDKREVVIDSFFYASSRYLLMFLGFARNFILARLLLPSDYGVWVVFITILAYADQAHLGLRHLGDLKIPFLRGSQKLEEMENLIREIFGGILVLGTAAFLALAGIAALDVRMSDLMRLGLLLVGGIVLSDQANKFYFMLQRAEKQFVSSSKIESAYEIAKTVALCLAVWWWNLLGALAAILASNVVLFTYFLARKPGWLLPRITVRGLAQLVTLSFALAMSGFLYLAQSSLDRVWGTFLLTKEQLGIYGLAALVASVPIIAAQGLGYVAYPRLNEIIGRSGKRDEFHEFFLKVLNSMTLMVPVLVMLLLFTIPYFITTLLPAYKDAVEPMIIVLLGGTFFSTTHLFTLFFLASHESKRCLRVQTVALGASVLAFAVILTLYSPSARSVAAGMAASLIISSVAFMHEAFTSIYQRGEVIAAVGKYLIFGLLALANFLMVNYLIDLFVKQNDLLTFAEAFVLKLACASALYGLLVLIYRRRRLIVLPALTMRRA